MRAHHLICASTWAVANESSYLLLPVEAPPCPSRCFLRHLAHFAHLQLKLSACSLSSCTIFPSRFYELYVLLQLLFFLTTFTVAPVAGTRRLCFKGMAASRFVVVEAERSWRRTDKGVGDNESVEVDRSAQGRAYESVDSGGVRDSPGTGGSDGGGEFLKFGSGLDSRFNNLSSLQRRKQRTQERSKQGKDNGADGGDLLAVVSPEDWRCTLDVNQRLALHADFMRLLEEVHQPCMGTNMIICLHKCLHTYNTGPLTTCTCPLFLLFLFKNARNNVRIPLYINKLYNLVLTHAIITPL